MFALQYTTIGLNVLKHRRLKNMTQSQLSEVAGISRAKISDIERGRGPYSIELVFLIAQALDVGYEEIIKA